MKRLLLFLGYFLLIFSLSFWVLNSGAISISPEDVFSLFQDEPSAAVKIFLHHRLPSLLTAILTGLALPSAGFVLQELFRNPLAGPSVLGISSASGLGVALYIFLFSGGSYFFAPEHWMSVLTAFAGALGAVVFLAFFARRVKSTESLIIIGLSVSAFSSSLVSLLEYFAPSEEIKTYILWGFGRISGLTYPQLLVYFICVCFGLLLCFLSLNGLQKLMLGKDYAITMGIKESRLRLLVFFGSSLLVAASTAFTGPILFVGLVVPFLCRFILRTSDMRLLWLVVLLSGVVVMLSFLGVSINISKEQWPINIIASFVGAPMIVFILWLLRKQEGI